MRNRHSVHEAARGYAAVDMTLRKLERAWLSLQLFDELILIYPTYAIMMQGQGISAVELSVLFVIWSASGILFEVP